MTTPDRLVLTLFARHDPLHLISIGAPADEYAHEVRRILSRSHEASDESQLRRILHEEFVRCFSAPLAGSERRYAALADELWALLQEKTP